MDYKNEIEELINKDFEEITKRVIPINNDKPIFKKEDFMNEALKETKFLMKKYKIKAKKGLGQNFLIDDDVLQDISRRSD